MRIALDLFGGDNAPESTIEGAKLACKNAHADRIKDFRVTLVGDRSKLSPSDIAEINGQIDLYHVPGEFYNNDAVPHAAGRVKKSPIRTALRLHSEGKFDAVVSAGSTGAQVVASLIELGACTGIKRPAIASLLPTTKGFCLLLDIGASLVAGPRGLVQFAVMGYLYSKEILGLVNPRISLLNVGKESGVGTRAIRVAHNTLDKSKFDYIGFVEGRDIMTGVADVIVTSGLIGNILLKYAEGFPRFLSHVLPKETADLVFSQIQDKMDYQRFGGEPLLGIKGVSVIGHGASSALAISSAVIKASKMVVADFHTKHESFMINEFGNFIS